MYRRRFLQANTYFDSFCSIFEIYINYILLYRSNLEHSDKIFQLFANMNEFLFFFVEILQLFINSLPFSAQVVMKVCREFRENTKKCFKLSVLCTDYYDHWGPVLGTFKTATLKKHVFSKKHIKNVFLKILKMRKTYISKGKRCRGPVLEACMFYMIKITIR